MPEVDVALSKDGRVHMLDDAGAPVTVARGDVKGALEAGFRVEGADAVKRRNLEREYGDLASQAVTAAEGAVEGATVGLGTAGLAAIMGDDYRRDALARREINPNAHLAGNVVGSVAPVLASGGASAGARGLALAGAPSRGVVALGGAVERGAMAGARAIMGEGAAASIAGKALGMGAAGAVEGAAYGLGGSIADAALEDTDWTAERALSAMADGAWYGFKGGAAIGGASGALTVAGRRAVAAMTEGRTFKEVVTEFGEQRAVKSVIGNNAKHYNELTNFGADKARAKRVGRKIIDNEIPTDDLPKAIGSLKGKATEAGERMQTVASELDGAGVKVDALKVLADVDAQIADLRKVGLGSHNKVATAIEREVAPLRLRLSTRQVPVTLEDLPTKGKAQNGSKWRDRMVAEGRLPPGPTGAPGKSRRRVDFAEQLPDEFGFSDWWKLRQQLDQTLNWAKRGGDPATDNLRKLRAQVDQGLDDAIARHTDEQARRLVVEGTDGAEASQARNLGAAWKQAKEDYADFVFLKEAAEDQAVRTEKNRWISASDYGTGTAFALGSALVSDDPNALESLAQGAAASVAHKFLRERGSGWIAKAADAIARSESRLTVAAKQLAGATRRAAIRAGNAREQAKERSEKFDGVMRHLERYQRDPEYASATLERIVSPVAREQPEVASKIAENYAADMAFLASKAPRATSAGARSFQPLKEEKFYTRDEKAQITKLAEALADPTAAIENIAEGGIDLDVIEALRVRRPREFAGLREKVMLECAELKDKLPFARRNFLSLVFDFEGDPSLEPATMAAIQASNPPPAQGQPPAAGAQLNAEKLTGEQLLPSQKAGV